MRFTKPVAYQEIDGKRVEVGVEYNIHGVEGDGEDGCGAEAQGSKDAWENMKPETSNSNFKTGTQKLESLDSKPEIYCFTVASYDTTKDLVIAPLLASTFLGGGGTDVGYGIAVDASNNVFVTGPTGSAITNLPTTTGAYDTT